MVPSVPDDSLFDLDALNCPVLPITPGVDIFPTISRQYSVTVSANFDQYDTLTMQYTYCIPINDNICWS